MYKVYRVNSSLGRELRIKREVSRISEDCIFCNIINHKANAIIIDQNDAALAFLDRFPLRAGHTLVVTKTHYSKIQEIQPAEMISLFELVTRMTSVLEISLKVNATLIAIHNGREAGQEVEHVHVHIIPRSIRDGGAPVHSIFQGRTNLDDSQMESIMRKIKDKL
jgi:histidine triad (HIT) family protein